MFEGRAEEAMNFYVSLFENSSITELKKYQANQGGKEGTIMKAGFTLAGQEYLCIDSQIAHGFSFTPAISIYVNCVSEQEIDNLFSKLSDGGAVMMPLSSYPFSEKFGWCSDKFGVSWQLNLINSK